MKILNFHFIFHYFLSNIVADQNEFEPYPETPELKSEYDFIIVGAGSAGCALANRLSEISNWDVLLIEAGGPETIEMDIPATAFSNQLTPYDWGYYAEPSNHFGLGFNNHTVYFPRGKVMGGSSVTNLMMYTRGNPKDYDQWNIDGWTFSDVEKYFIKLENYTIHDPENHFGKDGPMHVEVVPYHSDLSSHFLEAAQQYGLPLVNTNGPKQVGISRLQTTIKNGLRFSTNRGYLVPIRSSRPNLHLIRYSQVTKVLIENGAFPKVNGVEFVNSNGSVSSVYARKEVILSAGVFNSAQLLMLSGIGPEEHLVELGIPLVKDLPVGDNLMDHINLFGLQFVTNQTAFPEDDFYAYLRDRSGPLATPAGSEVIGFSLPLESGVPSIEHLFISTIARKPIFKDINLKQEIYEEVYEPAADLTGFMIYSILLHPKSHGWVRLRDLNPLSKPKIFPNYLSHPEDMKTLIAGIKEAIQITKQPGLQAYDTQVFDVPIPQCAKYEFGSDDYWECQIRATTYSLYHPCGTCKMGELDDRTAVVDSKLNVRGIRGLRVVDASIIPQIISGHINGPTIMIAEKGADLIKSDWGDFDEEK